MGLFGTIGGLLGGGSIKKGLNKAATAQQASSDDQIGRLNDALTSTTAGYSPYTSLGSSAADAYADLMGLGGSDASTDWGAYVNANPDALANWNAIKDTSDGSQFNGDINAFGQYHFNADGSRRDLSGVTTPGVSANDAQASAIASLEKSPLYTSLIRNGEEAILANGSATGGLRGGNMQGGLANFRADTLASTIQQQLAGYQGAIGTGLGAQGAVTNATYGTATGSNAAQQSATDALIQKILGKAGVNSKNWSNVGGFLDDAASGGGFGKAVSTIGSLF